VEILGELVAQSLSKFSLFMNGSSSFPICESLLIGREYNEIEFDWMRKGLNINQMVQDVDKS
jgi:hypothetical protein